MIQGPRDGQNSAIQVSAATRAPASNGGGTHSPLRRALQVLILFSLVYLLTWAGHYTTGDGAQKIAWAKYMLFGPSATLTPEGPHGVYSRYGIGHSLIAMPALAASFLIHKYTGIRSESVFYTLIFIANGALLVALIAYYLFHFFEPRRVWGTVFLIGLATTWWPYTKMDFSEPLVATILFAGFLLMRFGRPTAGMLLAAFTITIRTDSIILVALLALWWLLDHPSIRAALKLGLAIVPSLLIFAAGNYARYHSVFDHGYENLGFTTPFLVGLYGILLSAGKSVFLFSPPLVLGFLGWKRFHAQRQTRSDALLFAAIFIAQVLLYSKWWDWSSDDGWGVRFMLVGVVFMCIPLATILERRWLVLVLAAAGVCVQLLSVLVAGEDYLALIRQHDAQRQALFVSGQNRVDFEDLRFNPSYSQILGNWILIRCLLHIPPQPRPPALVESNGTSLYDTLPPSAWSQMAHWDLIWTLQRRKVSSAPHTQTDGSRTLYRLDRLPVLAGCVESLKRPLAHARGSADSSRYRAATVREPVATQPVRFQFTVGPSGSGCPVICKRCRIGYWYPTAVLGFGRKIRIVPCGFHA